MSHAWARAVFFTVLAAVHFISAEDECIAGACGFAADADEAPLMQVKTSAQGIARSNERMGDEQTDDDAPTAWCTSGGGFRALLATMGFARGFAQAGAFKDKGIFDRLGCNSGGCWFLSQFVYSEKFRKGILGEDEMGGKDSIEVFTNEFMSKYQENEHPGELPEWFTKPLKWVLEASKTLKDIAAFFDTAVGSIEFVWNHNFVWHGGVKSLIGTYGDLNTSSPAKQYFRIDVKSKAHLHFQTANMTSFLTTKPGGWFGSSTVQSKTFLTKGKERVYNNDVFDSIPLQYEIPPKTSTDKPTWLHATGEMSNADSIQDCNFAGATTPMADPFADGEEGLPTISQAAAMSSSAIGWFGSMRHTRAMLKSLFAHVPAIFKAPIVGTALRESLLQFLPMGMTWLAETSQCAGKLDENGNCPWGTQRLWDGAWADDVGVAQTVARMQEKYPDKKTFRVVLTNNNAVEDQCALGDLFPNLNTTVKPGGPRKAGAVGGPGFWDGLVKAGIKPLPQMFDKKFESIVWKNALETAEVEKDRLYPDSLPVGLRYATFKTKTVDNPAYGVKAGTIIDLLVFDLNSPLCLWWARAGNIGYAIDSVVPGQYCMGSFTDKSFYDDLSGNVAIGAKAVMEKWKKGEAV